MDLANGRAAPRIFWDSYYRSAAEAVSFVLYHTSTDSHPGFYPIDPDFDAESTEFRATMAGATGMPIIDGNRVEIYNNGDEFYPAMLQAIESAQSSITME